MKQNNQPRNRFKKKLAIGKNEDVEFSAEAADAEDVEAVRRMNAADNRQES